MRVHVYPVDDVRGHVLHGLVCWCRPYEDEDDLIIHRTSSPSGACQMANVYIGEPEAAHDPDFRVAWNDVNPWAFLMSPHRSYVKLIEPEENNVANVYEGKPDERQAGEIKPTIFRPRYRSLTDEEVVIHDEIKAKAEELLKLFDFVEDGRYKSLAITSLEQSIMWIVKGLTS